LERYQLEVVAVEAQPWLAIAYAADEESLVVKVEQALAVVYSLASKWGIETSGWPLTRFSDRSGPEFVAETGFPISEDVNLDRLPRLAAEASRGCLPGFGPVQRRVLPAGQAATTVHWGPYTTLPVAHRTLRGWGRDHEFTFVGGPWEVYVSDPILASDSRRLETRLFQPIQ